MALLTNSSVTPRSEIIHIPGELIELQKLIQAKVDTILSDHNLAESVIADVKAAIFTLAAEILKDVRQPQPNLNKFANRLHQIWDIQRSQTSNINQEWGQSSMVDEAGRTIGGYSNFSSLFNLNGAIILMFTSWLIENFGDIPGIDELIVTGQGEA